MKVSDDNIEVYLRLFKGREDYFAQQNERGYKPIPRRLDNYFLQRHFHSDATFGIYLLNRNSQCNLICIDIDIPKSELDQVDFSDTNQKYKYLKHQLDTTVETLTSSFKIPQESILVEETGGRGYHIWVFFEEPVDGLIAIKFGEALKKELGFEIEFFPKQGRLTPKRKYGNLIKLPLGLHKKYGARSSFIHHTDEDIRIIDNLDENLAYIRKIVPMPTDSFCRIVGDLPDDINESGDYSKDFKISESYRPNFIGEAQTLVEQCNAMKHLFSKAQDGIKLSHSEAFYFADIMLSIPDGQEMIHKVMRNTHGNDYNQKKTQEEIEKIRPLQPPNCLTLVQKGICSGYCKESVKRKNEDPLVSNTTPGSVWLRWNNQKIDTANENLLECVGRVENVRLSFLQLRQYHEHEDALFYDPFDFEQYSLNMDSNCSVIAKSLSTKTPFPLLGYLPVQLPKKIDEEKRLIYRGMSYSTIYDQIFIQSIFNPIAPVLEKDFQSSSYGYRWNLDSSKPYRIFENWREAYPRFRNAVLEALKHNPNGYHICCDIKGYYDHINHTILLEQLRKSVYDPYIFSCIETIIKSYNADDGNEYGLPQGPAYARLLANLYLNEFDIINEQRAVAYFRYVDDFVLVFDTKEDAEHTLDFIATYLKELNLELSQDDSKLATITPNTNISRVRKTLDKIHYGMLEGTRQVEHLAPQAVADFMNAVERHSMTPVNLDELIQINEKLPSLLYTISQEKEVHNNLQQRIVQIIDFLIQHKWFFPKKLKTIFYRLINLSLDSMKLYDLYDHMDPIHKTYFLLSVFGSYQTHGKHKALLERIVCDGLYDDNPYILGFSITIASRMELKIEDIIPIQELIIKLSNQDQLFSRIKWLSIIEYSKLGNDERTATRNLINRGSPDLVKVFLLSSIKYIPSNYVDSIYITGLLSDNSILYLSIVCDLITTVKDYGEVFRALEKYIYDQYDLKSLAITYISERLFQKKTEAGKSEIENLITLYQRISDDELKRCMIGSLSRIEQYKYVGNIDFAKEHREIARYNECFLFEMLSDKPQYNYLELIPRSRLHDHLDLDVNSFKDILEDLSSKRIIPTCNLSYESNNEELILKYNTNDLLQMISSEMFTLSNDSILKACTIASQVYKKANYFRHLTGKIPEIKLENIIINHNSNMVLIQTIGRALCTHHTLNGIVLGDEESDIARMIATFLESLIFNNQSDLDNFLEENHYTGMEAFLYFFIKRLKSKDPSHRLSCSRFEYIVNQMHQVPMSGMVPTHIESIYLRERLKGAIYRVNSGYIKWQGACKILDDHLGSHLRSICSQESLQNYPFRSRIQKLGMESKQLHSITKNLLNLSYCRQDFRSIENYNPEYLDLVELLLVYASISLEIVAFTRCIQNIDSLHKIKDSQLLRCDEIQLHVDGHQIPVSQDDVATLIMQYPDQLTDGPISGLSLRHLCLLALLCCKTNIKDHIIIVHRPDKVKPHIFSAFVHACLFRIPLIESSIIEELESVFTALQSNEDIHRISILKDVHTAMEFLCKDITHMRSSLSYKRYNGHADGSYFPPDIRCRKWLHKNKRVKEQTLPGCVLTNSFPSSRQGYWCSWDVKNKNIVNLMIPSLGIHTLINDLTKGKLFGFKLTYLYSGRAMIFSDILIFILFAGTYALCELGMSSTSSSTFLKAILSILSIISGAVLLTVISKIVFYDLKLWSRQYNKVISFIRKRFSEGENRIPSKDST